jgi:RND family efflux transporter MFP subunit
VEEAAAALASARAATAAARTTADYARIIAPFDGIVTEKLVEPGNLASPGVPLLRVDRSGRQRVDVYLDETRAAALAVGAAVTVALPDTRLGEPYRPPRVVDATIAEMARAVDVGARSVLVKVALPALDGVPSGTFARVQFAGESRSNVAVPVSAVRRHGQVSSVFVVDGEVVRLRLVRTAEQVEGQIAIDAGLDADERVVVNPSAQLSDGRAVRVAPSGGRS